MPFIRTVPEKSAKSETAAMYKRAKDEFGRIPNFVKAFSHRPSVFNSWNDLLDSIKKNIGVRRYELVTIAAAKELRSSYCMLAHGSVLLGGHFDSGQLKAIVDTPEQSPLDAVDRAIMKFAVKVVRDAASITEADIDGLREHGLTDEEVFDIASVAAVRCFFTKTLDAIGVQPDSAYKNLEVKLRDSLVLGRPIED